MEGDKGQGSVVGAAVAARRNGDKSHRAEHLRMRNLGVPPVVLYHGIAPETSPEDPCQSVSQSLFERQMRWLAQHGRRTLDLDGFLACRFGSGSARRSVLLTFDDGYRSTFELALPILHNLGMRALLFIPSGMVGRTATWLQEVPDTPLVDANELRELSVNGVEVGVHGLEHLSMPGLSDRELLRNTKDARDALSDVLGTAPRAFAYPDGRFDGRVAAAVERAGFTVAFSAKQAGGRYGVPRAEVGPLDDMRTFRLKLLPGYHALNALADRFPMLRRRLRAAIR
jgi:peptidoglycan/xylan/chitin deacetylase (PgdA/CDA1 family)